MSNIQCALIAAIFVFFQQLELDIIQSFFFSKKGLLISTLHNHKYKENKLPLYSNYY